MKQAHKTIKNDGDVKRLCQALKLLGHFWEDETALEKNAVLIDVCQRHEKP